MGNDNLVETERSPRKWWQWVLMYPAIAISMAASLPTCLEAYNSWKIGVPFGEYQVAYEQNRLWQKNYDCSKGIFDSVKNSNNVQVGAIVCETGDVLLKVAPPNVSPTFRWVGVKTFPRLAFLDYLIKPAYAGELDSEYGIRPVQYYPPMLLCQRWIQPGVLLRRISTGYARCVDEVINTFTGAVLDRRPAPCVRRC